MTYNFENLRIEIPRAESPGGQHTGGAQCTVNGKILITTEVYEKGYSNSCLNVDKLKDFFLLKLSIKSGTYDTLGIAKSRIPQCELFKCEI